MHSTKEPNSSPNERNPSQSRRWLYVTIWIVVALGISIVIAGAAYFVPIHKVNADNYGDLASALLSAMAFVAVVISTMAQSQALSQNIEELRITTTRMMEQNDALTVANKLTRDDISTKYYEVCLQRLSTLATSIYFRLEVQSGRAFGTVDESLAAPIHQDLNLAWERFSNGDLDTLVAFFRRYLERLQINSLDDERLNPSIQKHILAVAGIYRRDLSEGIQRLRSYDAPKFMIDHLEHGSPDKLNKLFERLIAVRRSEVN